MDQQSRTTAAQIDPQNASLLFQKAPQEIRNHIYFLLFSSTRFSFGSDWDYVLRPALNGLALARTCRRAWLEIGDSWLGQVLFCFDDIHTMLDKLTVISAGTLSKIRYLRVRGDTLPLAIPLGDVYTDDRWYRLNAVFKLLPGLQLEQLTVLSETVGWSATISYQALGRLIEHGQGWKTLRYVGHSSALIGFASEHEQDLHFNFWNTQTEYWREPQPARWQSVLEGRDGPASKPSVTIYRAAHPSQRISAAGASRLLPQAVLPQFGSVLDPNKRVQYEQRPRQDPDSQPNVFAADPKLMTGDEQFKELLVIVKRGTGVDYEEKPNSPFLEDDIRAEFPGRSWTELRNHALNYFSNEEETDRPIRRDVYIDPDEYEYQPTR